jgi:hypothetical protein
MNFKEIKRITLTDKADLVISEASENNTLTGVTICRYIKTEKYTGFTKATLIPVANLDEIIKELAKIKDSIKS